MIHSYQKPLSGEKENISKRGFRREVPGIIDEYIGGEN